ncbi:MAG: amidase [Myxococcota bacterium]|nr:amidase [Myxococcota bacterium]
MNEKSLHYQSATSLAGMIRRGELSAREVLKAHLDRIESINPTLNAIVTLVPERAMAWAAEADERQARGEALGPLHGLPIAHKDLVMTEGIRSTSGSLLMAEHVPSADDLVVERLRSAGAITLGKTNVPEFGAGSQTYNEVFGETLNPWDTTRTCGGSSGGAAVALATGMVPIADGSDMGGSLRNPASFCSVIGLRPSPGRVPIHPSRSDWSPLSVLGPMARTVEDTALLLSAMAGPDARAPLSLSTPGEAFRESLERDFKGVRVAWSRDLGGLPVDSRVSSVIEASRGAFAGLGCEIEDAEPDWSGADEAFKAFRAWEFAQGFGGLPESAARLLKETVRWNIEQGRGLSVDDMASAEKRRGAIYQRVRTFMDEYEFMVLPVSQVPPFAVSTRYPEEIEGVAMETYIDWMKSAYFITLTGHPAISVPCGFTDEGLPVGIQIVGRWRDDFGVLQFARALERALDLESGISSRHPPID